MRFLPILAAILLSPGLAAAEPDYQREIENLRKQLRQKDAEIAKLRHDLTAQKPPKSVPLVTPVAATPPPAPAPQTTQTDDEDILATALETALVRQGGRVLSQGAMEIEPELSYFYGEPFEHQRRDTYGAALTGRIGLPWSSQIEVRIPYIISDHWSRVGTSSGIGDIRVGVTTELIRERERIPAVLGFVQWRSTSGNINDNPPTGFGQNAISFGLTATKRLDPIVLLGSGFYTANIGNTNLRSGIKLNNGDVAGGRLAAFLSVTPDTSLSLGISVNSFSADRFNNVPLDSSDRLRAAVEIGAAMTLGHNLFFNVTAAIGITPAAPNFGVIASMPYRF